MAVDADRATPTDQTPLLDQAPLLEGHGLEKRYGGVVALTDVSIRLAPGEILGLVGPNGAGKTTLVDCISGIQTANSGTLTLRGVKLHGPASRRAKAGLARTFQYPQLALDLTVGENLLMGRAAKQQRSWWRMIVEATRGTFWPGPAADAEAVASIADELGIGRLDRMAGDLSLGEQRLLEVGRALGQDPLVLLLDEPFAGSDAGGVTGIIEVIRTVQRRGHGIILVDHNVDLVSSLVDRIMLLDQGRVVFDGDPQECITSAEMQRVYFGAGLAEDDELDGEAEGETGSASGPSAGSPSTSGPSAGSPGAPEPSAGPDGDTGTEELDHVR